MRHLKTSIMMVVGAGVLLGLVFPIVILGIARVAFPRQAEGSLLSRDGKVIGSELIGQSFAEPEYFHPRPSAAGSGYDASASGGTNLGPTSSKFINGIHKKLPDGKDDPGNFDGIGDLAAAYRKENGLAAGTPLPAEAVTRSASGLDPHISPANAALQVARVAKARGMREDEVRGIVGRCTEGRTMGLLGEARVNVLKANLELDGAQGRKGLGASTSGSR